MVSITHLFIHPHADTQRERGSGGRERKKGGRERKEERGKEEENLKLD